MGDRTRSFLKIQDGCDYGCSYCTIPLARGRSRNPEISALINEAEQIAERGIKEIVLTGVNIGDFGKSTGDSFLKLLKELVKVQGIERFRISSIEPNLLTDELIEFTAKNEKILPHFHIPLTKWMRQNPWSDEKKIYQRCFCFQSKNGHGEVTVCRNWS